MSVVREGNLIHIGMNGQKTKDDFFYVNLLNIPELLLSVSKVWKFVKEIVQRFALW